MKEKEVGKGEGLPENKKKSEDASQRKLCYRMLCARRRSLLP